MCRPLALALAGGFAHGAGQVQPAIKLSADYATDDGEQQQPNQAEHTAKGDEKRNDQADDDAQHRLVFEDIHGEHQIFQIVFQLV